MSIKPQLAPVNIEDNLGEPCAVQAAASRGSPLTGLITAGGLQSFQGEDKYKLHSSPRVTCCWPRAACKLRRREETARADMKKCEILQFTERQTAQSSGSQT